MLRRELPERRDYDLSEHSKKEKNAATGYIRAMCENCE
jgi:hypothetical protein